jgi:hypothetical protein
MDIFKKLLKLNPSDNLGVRYAICGILEGYSGSRHVWNKNGHVISNWYKDKVKKYLEIKEYSFLKKFIF